MTRRLAVAAVVTALTLSAGIGAAVAAKKGGSLKTRVLTGPQQNLAIPDDPDGLGNTGAGVLQTQLQIGKKAKGLRIDDVNVGMRVTHGDTSDLKAKITAPNGGTAWLVVGHASGPAWGAGAASCGGTFFFVDDESPLFTSPDPVNFVPDTDLPPPYAGRSNTPMKPLSLLDGGPVRGTWTLTVIDRDGPGNVGTLHCWRLEVKPQRG